MSPRAKFAALLACLVLVVASFSHAQNVVETGIPAYGAVGGGSYDAINLANLNAHLGVPVFSKPGRELPFSYTLVNESTVWVPGGQTWQPATNWGWAGKTQVTTGYLTYTDTIKTHTCVDPGPPRTTWTETYDLYKYIAYIDSLGKSHPINVSLNDGICGGVAAGNVTVYPNDGSGLKIVVNIGFTSVTTREGLTLLSARRSGGWRRFSE